MKNYYVYKITHIPTGKTYIGRKTATPEKFENYWGSSTHPLFISKKNKKFAGTQCSFIEDNIEDYSKEVIELCSNATELGKRETYWIRHYKKESSSVNKFDNHKFTTAGMSWEELYGENYEEIKEHFSKRTVARNKSKKIREANRKRMTENNPMKSEDARRKVGEAQRKLRTGVRNEKLLAGAHTPEAKKKRSETMKRRTELGLNKAFLEANKGKDNNHFIYATKGTIFINKEGVNKRIKPEQLSEFEKQGWTKGRYVPKRTDSKR